MGSMSFDSYQLLVRIRKWGLSRQLVVIEFSTLVSPRNPVELGDLPL